MSIEVIMPTGALGYENEENAHITALRLVGIAFGDSREWASKYGTTYENDIFMMHKYCWCDNCIWCDPWEDENERKLKVELKQKFGTTEKTYYDKMSGYYDPPHFWFKPSNARCRWYKYIGRDMQWNNNDLPKDWLKQVFDSGAKMSIEEAIDLLDF